MKERILHGPPIRSVPKKTLGQFFFDSSTKFSDRTCQIDAFTDHHETFLDVKRKTVRTALKMQECRITQKDVIVLCSTVTLDTPIPMIASFYLGAKVANLDPTLSVRQVTYLLSLVSPKMIFVQEASVSLIEESIKDVSDKPEIVVFGKSEIYKQFSDFVQTHQKEDVFTPVSVDDEDVAIMFFSSGTTGLPKAVCHSSRSFLHIAHAFYQRGGKFDTTLSFTSFYWISAMMYLTCSFICGGCRIVCGSTVEAEKTFQLIEKYKITYMFLAPVLTYNLTNFADYHKYDTSSLYSILTGGTSISIEQYRKIRDVFKHSTLVFGYGLTETNGVSIFDPEEDKDAIFRNMGSCGKIAPGVSLKIVDTETNQLLGPNQTGEICVKTPSLMKGYYNADSSTVFDDSGFLKTGDMGYYNEEGCLYVVGRLKEMFKYKSWHIVPSAIEEVIHEHPAVQEAVVFGYPVNEEEGEVPAAAIIFKENSTVAKEEIIEFVNAKVSDREKLQAGIYIMKEFPRTPTGKVKRIDVKNSILGNNNNK